MKKTFLFHCAIIACAIFLAACSSSGFSDEELEYLLSTKWQAYTSGKKNFNGGIAVQILSPKGNFFASYGMGQDMSHDHHFRPASVTKTFTAAGIMLLAQRGLLNIEHKISDNIPGKDIPYVPDTAQYAIPNKADITIKMVLMHRAGIFDLSNQAIEDNAASHLEPYVGQNYYEYVLESDPDHQFTFDELFGVIARDEQRGFDGPPDSQYKYSDTAYCLLALIIERVSGKSYGEFIRDELLVPNGLADTSMPWEGFDQGLPDPFVPSYSWVNDTPIDTTLSNMSPYVGNGNMITTMLDLATWAKKLLTGNAGLSMETIELMKTGLPAGEGSTSTYGLGIIHSKDFGYGHSGAHPSYLTNMYYKPESDVVHVMMSNIWDCETCGTTNESLKTQMTAMAQIMKDILEQMGY